MTPRTIAIAGLLGLIGAGFAGYKLQQQVPSPDAITLDRTPETPAQEPTRPATGLVNSSDRRTEDFGSGPSGKVVADGIGDRHRQAFGDAVPGGDEPADRASAAARPAAGQPAADAEIDTDIDPDAAAVAAAGIGSEDAAPEGVAPAIEPGAGPETEVAALSAPPDETGDDRATSPAGTGAGTAPGTAPKIDVIERPAPAGEAQPGAAPPGSTPPSFDVIRVTPEGNAVIAGRADPHAEVTLKAGEQVLDKVRASARGEWVSIPSAPLEVGDQELSLESAGGDARPIPSSQIVVVSIPEPLGDDGAVPLAVLVDEDEGASGRILQAPDQIGRDGALALQMVDYDKEGAVRLAGSAPPGVPVRIYLDNQPASVVIGDAKGYWITTLDQSLPPGDYTLRLDQLDESGQAVARIETPLTRVGTPPVEGKAKVDYVVVQPGNSLWRIARRLSGDGFNYLYIFEANKAQIRDPDKIYPGQVFEVPPGSVEAQG
jgi:nucleoid-associated protein YgaU